MCGSVENKTFYGTISFVRNIFNEMCSEKKNKYIYRFTFIN